MHGKDLKVEHAADDAPKLEHGTHAIACPNIADKFTVATGPSFTGAWLTRTPHPEQLGLISELGAAYVAVYSKQSATPKLVIGIDDRSEPFVQLAEHADEPRILRQVPLSAFLAAVDWSKIPVDPA